MTRSSRQAIRRTVRRLRRMWRDATRPGDRPAFNFVGVGHGEHTYECSDEDFAAEALPQKRNELDLNGSML